MSSSAGQPGTTARLVWEVLSQMLYAHAKHHL